MASHRTETRHHPTGKTCHHYARFRLTCDEFDNLKVRARGSCEICKTPEADVPGGKLVVDHYSGPGISHVRGLLCNRCNRVMACLDGTRTWGANRAWEAEARRYASNSWHTPAEGVERAARLGPIDRVGGRPGGPNPGA